jgi:AcrR family transcriptional regulator
MRDQLVGAALTVLRRDGAAGLTVRAVTAEAGCSTTGVYTYFGGKHGLVEAVFVDGFESFDAAVAPALERGDLVEAGRRYRRWALGHPMQYMVMFGRAVPDFEPSDSARGRAMRSFAALADGVARAGPGDDVVARAYRLFATVHGFVMLEMAGMASAADELYEGALRALAPPSNAGSGS